MIREKHLEEITGHLEKWARLVEISAGASLFNIHQISEDGLIRILNKIFDVNLVNLNIQSGQNFAGIDLGDEQKRKCFQISSDSSREKIKETVDTFILKKHYEKYDELYLIALTSKKVAVRKDVDTKGKFIFSLNSNVLDFGDLLNKIRPLSPADMEEISKLLHSELEKDNPNNVTLSDEVRTIIDLIATLSKERILEPQVWKLEPDPLHKIQHRFSEHSALLEEEFTRLLPRFAPIYSEIEKVNGSDLVTTTYITDYLKSESNRYLMNSNNNPLVALEQLTANLEQKISASGVKHSAQAIRFYILRELVNCNIFPN